MGSLEDGRASADGDTDVSEMHTETPTSQSAPIAPRGRARPFGLGRAPAVSSLTTTTAAHASTIEGGVQQTRVRRGEEQQPNTMLTPAGDDPPDGPDATKRQPASHCPHPAEPDRSRDGRGPPAEREEGGQKKRLARLASPTCARRCMSTRRRRMKGYRRRPQTCVLAPPTARRSVAQGPLLTGHQALSWPIMRAPTAGSSHSARGGPWLSSTPQDAPDFVTAHAPGTARSAALSIAIWRFGRS